jgi:thiol-disulfide isomerase/thioredoxin
MSPTDTRGTALITGASAGIGAVYVDRLAKRGYDLIVVARHRTRLATLAHRIKSETGRSVETIAADLGDKADLARVESVLRANADIAILVNNAGVAAVTPPIESDVEKAVDHRRRWLLAGAAATLAAAGFGKAAHAAAMLPVEGELPSFGGATAWLNSAPLTAADLRGKVVLVNFWTLTCINWLRTLPYVRAWAAKYKEQGLVVIGVHTPEFTFEQDIDNIRRAATAMNVDYPIAVDSRYAIWRAFDNHYWPALYFVDAQGRIRHHQFGEGEYEESERVIQRLLAEAGAGQGDQGLVAAEARGSELAADWRDLKSQENYLGYARTEGFSSGRLRKDAPSLYRTPAALPLNTWGLSGAWTVGPEFVAANEKSGRITYRFHARDLHLVIAPPVAGREIRFRVRLDGAAPGADHGVDVDEDGLGIVRDGRLYQLVRQAGTVADRSFEIEFLDPGIRAYAFTFG